MSDLTIDRITAPFRTIITPPGSKSLTNRALILAALARGQSVIRNILFADDTRVMLDCLQKLGLKLQIDEPNRTVQVDGQGGGIPAKEAELFCGNSGTTIRFTSALCSLGRGRYSLDGVPRMRQRPIGSLVDLMRNLGARIQYRMAEGYPPIEMIADG